MKRLLIVLLSLTLLLSLSACKSKQVEEKVEENTNQSTTLANPVVEYDSLEEINEKIDVKLMKPPIMGVSNERFAIISDRIAEYTCDINGLKWIFRAAHITDEDISGMYSEYNEFIPNQDSRLYVNEFYLDRFFDGDKQYTIVVIDPITEDGELVLDESVYGDCVLELELIQKYHLDDPVVGEFKEINDESVTAYIERNGDLYTISVNVLNTGTEFICHTMYDAIKEDNKLTYKGEEIGHYTYDEEGNETSSDMTVSNNLGYFEIKDDKLYWTSPAKQEYSSFIFEKIVYEE